MSDPINPFPYLVNTNGLPDPYPAGPRFIHNTKSKRPVDQPRHVTTAEDVKQVDPLEQI